MVFASSLPGRPAGHRRANAGQRAGRDGPGTGADRHPLRCLRPGAGATRHRAGDGPLRAGQGGAIVNIASISGLRASPLRVAYGTSKAALIHLTRQYAVELGNVGVRVNAIAPGPVETEMAKLVHSVALRSDYYDAIPMGRYGTVQEMARTVGFLCSDEASFINGQVLAVDGGFDAAGVGLPTLRRHIGAPG